VAFTYDRYGHLFPEVDVGGAAKLEALRNFGQGALPGLLTARIHEAYAREYECSHGPSRAP